MVRGASYRLAGHGPQLRGSVWLMIAVMTNAGGGFLFWLVAARLYDGEDFGRAAALFTTVLFVNYATSLGLPVAVARYAPDRSETSVRFFNWSLVATAASSVVGSVVVLLALPDDVVGPLWEWGRPAGTAMFAVIVIGMAFTMLCEVRLMALRRWGTVLLRAGLVAAVRVPLLWAHPLDSDALWLFVLVAGVPALSGLILAAALGRPGRGRLRPLPEETPAAVGFARVNYVGLLALQAPQFAMPVIVLVNVSATTMASFYVAFSIAAVVFLIPHTLGQVLLVEGGKDQRHPRSQVKLGLALAVGLTVLATAAAFALAGLVTALYGSDFELAADALPWFVAASVPWAVTSIQLTSARLVQDRRAILAITVTLAVTTLVPAVALVPPFGVAGAAVAWIVGNVCAAAVAVVVGRRISHAEPVPYGQV